jgi:predicted permease
MTLREWLHRLWGSLRRSRTDRDLEDELQTHFELAADEERRRGASEEGAARTARLRVGAVAQATEAQRDQRGLLWLEDLVRDLRYAGRMLAKNPGFTAVSVLSLAIGIGANCAVFSFADTLLLRPLTVPHAGDLLTVGLTGSFRDSLITSYREYVDIRDQSRSFDGLAATTKSTTAFSIERGATPTLALGMLVSGNFFQVVGVDPQLGRAFRPDEDQVPGRDAVLILGHDFWERQFGADPAVVGRTVLLNQIEFTVVGVMPPGFTGLDQYVRYQYYAPIMMWPRLIADANIRPLEARDFRSVTIAGRLKRGMTVSQAQAELSTIAASLERAYPDVNRNRRIVVRTELQNRIAQDPSVATLLTMLAMLAAAVLCIACANVAGLLTSRAPTRAREIALRLAIGADRSRVIRQLITESVLVAIIGGIVGLGVGYAAVMLFNRIQIPTDLPIVATFGIDRRAVLISLAIALVSVLFFGLTPAIRSTRTDLTAVMKATDAAGFGRRRRWGRAVLVGGQVAVSVILLVVATFVYRGFEEQLGKGPGFRVDHLLMMSVAPSQVHYSDAQAQRFFEQLAESARHVPGVRAASLTRYMPMDGLPPPVTIVPEGFQFPAGKESATVASSIIDEHYFDTIALPVLKGRGFRATDSANAPRVAVVNELLAQHYWPGEDPLGKRFRLDSGSGPWVEVVGVAKMSKYSFALERPTEFVYFPYRQRAAQSIFLLVESAGDPATLATPLRAVVQTLDANLPVSNVRTMQELYRMRSVVVLNVVITIIGAMGVMGLGLAIVGLYGLVAYAATRRTKEIGIRMAIGADRSSVLRMVLRQGLVLAASGLAAGLFASIAAGRGLAAVFPGLSTGNRSADLAAFFLVASTVFLVTLLAAFLPARRASRINPTEALRCE